MPLNILFIVSDQHNPRFTGYEGHPCIETPNLDALAARGVRFANAYCQNPICVPSRYSMLSGLCSRDIGVYDNHHVPRSDLPSFARLLSEHGYRTCLIGKAHFTGPDQFWGYQERPYGDLVGLGHQPDPYRGAHPALEGVNGIGHHPAGGCFKLAGPSGIPELQIAENIINHEAVKWLQIHRETCRERPFLLSVHYPRPHFPFAPPKRWFDRYAGRVHCPLSKREDFADRPRYHRGCWELYQGYGATQEDVDRGLAGYAGNVSFVDECIGRLLDSVEHLGFAEDTIVIYSADHGEMAGAHGLWHKQLFYEESVRVPLIFAGPGVECGGVREDVVGLIDLFPTLCDLAGVTIPDHCAGVSLKPLLPGPAKLSDRTIFSEINWQPGRLPAGAMLRRGRWKYVWYTDESEELYDLEADPNENANIVCRAELQCLRKEFQRELLAFWRHEEMEKRVASVQRWRNKGAHPVAMQWRLPDGSWTDAWP